MTQKKHDHQHESHAEGVDDPERLHPLEEGLDAYPLRDASADPLWAVRTVKVWIGIMIFLLVFFIYLTVAGIWYD